MGVRRPELVVVAAIVVSLPMLRSFSTGGVDPATALVRFVLALLVCWAGLAVIERMYDKYSSDARKAELHRAVEEARRRLSDAAAPTERQDSSGSR